MLLRKLTRLAAGAAAFCAGMAPCSFARVGSVISSFHMREGPARWVAAVYRDQDYVYGVLEYGPSDYEYRLVTFNVDGSVVASVPLEYVPGQGHEPLIWLRDADHSTLGAGYVGLLGTGHIYRVYGLDFDVETGSFVRRFNTLDIGTAYAHIPGGNYIYIGETYPNHILRLTTSGSFVSSFRPRDVCDVLAATDYFEGRYGAYLITYGGGSGLYHHIYTDDGSLLDSFWLGPFAMISGGVCGPGYPSDYGITYWCIDGSWCFQIDLANGVAVAPASVGKVKALFR
jgi:hypothetical protein